MEASQLWQDIANVLGNDFREACENEGPEFAIWLIASMVKWTVENIEPDGEGPVEETVLACVRAALDQWSDDD